MSQSPHYENIIIRQAKIFIHGMPTQVNKYKKVLSLEYWLALSVIRGFTARVMKIPHESFGRVRYFHDDEAYMKLLSIPLILIATGSYLHNFFYV